MSPVLLDRTQVLEIVFAKDQPEYTPLPALVANGKVMTRWRPDAEELAKLMQGEDVIITLFTFGGPPQPIRVEVPVDGRTVLDMTAEMLEG